MVLSWTGPSAHGAKGRQEEGLQGALSAALPWSLPGLGALGGGATARVNGGARGHTTRVTAPVRRGGGAGVDRWLSGLQGSPTTELECTGLHGAVLAWASVMKLEGHAHTWRFPG